MSSLARFDKITATGLLLPLPPLQGGWGGDVVNADILLAPAPAVPSGVAALAETLPVTPGTALMPCSVRLETEAVATPLPLPPPAAEAWQRPDDLINDADAAVSSESLDSAAAAVELR
jgi:hypothetical protein